MFGICAAPGMGVAAGEGIAIPGISVCPAGDPVAWGVAEGDGVGDGILWPSCCATTLEPTKSNTPQRNTDRAI